MNVITHTLILVVLLRYYTYVTHMVSIIICVYAILKNMIHILTDVSVCIVSHRVTNYY